MGLAMTVADPLDAMETPIDRAIAQWDDGRRPKDLIGIDRKLRRVGDSVVSQNAGGFRSGCRRMAYRDCTSSPIVALGYVVDGSGDFVEEDRTISLRKGDVWVVSNNHPIRFTINDWNKTFTLILPVERLEATLRFATPTSALKIAGDSPLGAVVSAFMLSLSGAFDELDDRSAEAGIRMAIDVVGGAINAHAEPVSGASRLSLYDRVLDYIDRQLDDLDLSPAKIAREHGISRRYLDTIFANSNWTVSGWIRERRLLRCREELRAGREGRSLTEIAHGWGFCDSAHFSRSFSKRFGMPPKSWRNRFAASVSSAGEARETIR
ncbi:hypothetical protein BH10PSE12_BH10PSE12_22640 [soil metagenome]